MLGIAGDDDTAIRCSKCKRVVATRLRVGVDETDWCVSSFLQINAVCRCTRPGGRINVVLNQIGVPSGVVVVRIWTQPKKEDIVDARCTEGVVTRFFRIKISAVVDSDVRSGKLGTLIIDLLRWRAI